MFLAAPLRYPCTMFGQPQAWYIAVEAPALSGVVKARILGVDLVLFRDAEGLPHALIDRCPHRGVPLSFGRVHGGALQCGYHGWKFDGRGAVVEVPGLATENLPGRCVTSYPVREQQGFIWVWMAPEVEPTNEPFHFRLAEAPGYLTVRKRLTAPASLLAVAENALDVPHTAFLHGGLFRSDGDRNAIRCVVKRSWDRVEAEYIGEPRPTGLAARILSPGGGIVTHFDRFYLPSVLEVEYRIGEENHILLNGACTPVDEDETVLYAVVSVASRIPGFLLRPVVQPLALHIFSQDVTVLKLQSEARQKHGDQYVSTEIDLLGPHIGALLKRAASGKLDPEAREVEREVTMLV